ncbi:hypothetical protein [Bifidobacterium vespertilionis]|uniref:hypothetical protein n=1 Tax=Bifidobacterium vespertilionis TaxID=2562524 RepID=UPI001BDCE88E|nr:hypothetical protein [Bifidobacterium vespertilionis]MBT1179329.1 hypothetical protein [Bifidobacterium vespertilionis]
MLVGTHSPSEPWAVESNREILAFAPRHRDRVVLVDWSRVITANPSGIASLGAPAPCDAVWETLFFKGFQGASPGAIAPRDGIRAA